MLDKNYAPPADGRQTDMPGLELLIADMCKEHPRMFACDIISMATKLYGDSRHCAKLYADEWHDRNSASPLFEVDAPLRQVVLVTNITNILEVADGAGFKDLTQCNVHTTTGNRFRVFRPYEEVRDQWERALKAMRP